MTKKNINLRFGVIAALIMVAALSRLLLVGLPNFSPLGGIALFGAAYFAKKHWAFVLPIVALWLSSFLLDNTIYAAYYDGIQFFSNPMVYVGLILMVVWGTFIMKKVDMGRVVFGSLGASIIFFLVSNFGSWLAMYPKTSEGLMAAYAAGVPFFANTMLSDLFFAGVLFGAFELFQSVNPKLKLA